MLTAPVIRIKKGDSIRWSCVYASSGVPVDLTGYEIHCEIREGRGAHMAAPTVTLANQTTNPGEFEIYLASTESFHVATYLVDLRVREPNSDSYASESWQLAVQSPVTARW